MFINFYLRFLAEVLCRREVKFVRVLVNFELDVHNTSNAFGPVIAKLTNFVILTLTCSHFFTVILTTAEVHADKHLILVILANIYLNFMNAPPTCYPSASNTKTETLGSHFTQMMTLMRDLLD